MGMTSPTSPVYVRDSETSADTYMFPDWGIGMIIAAGILVIFIMLCCVVLVRGILILTLLNLRDALRIEISNNQTEFLPY